MTITENGPFPPGAAPSRSPAHLLLVALLLLHLVPALLAPAPLLAASGAEARLDQLQTELERYEKSGQPPPARLLEELMKALAEAQNGAPGADGPPPPDDQGFTDVPFTGTITITRSVGGMWSTEGSFFEGNSNSTVQATVLKTREVKGKDGVVEELVPQVLVAGDQLVGLGRQLIELHLEPLARVKDDLLPLAVEPGHRLLDCGTPNVALRSGTTSKRDDCERGCENGRLETGLAQQLLDFALGDLQEFDELRRQLERPVSPLVAEKRDKPGNGL